MKNNKHYAEMRYLQKIELDMSHAIENIEHKLGRELTNDEKVVAKLAHCAGALSVHKEQGDMR